MPEVGGVVHTHSTFAVAWAARGEEIPCVITGMADEFGGPIPVGPFAIIGDDSIGRGIVETLSGHRSRAVLMQNHGPFTIGVSAKDAVKAAVMCEDAARTVHYAREAGPSSRSRRTGSTRSTTATRTSTDRARTTADERPDHRRPRQPGHRARLHPHQGMPHRPRREVLATGSHEWENVYADKLWTYSLDAVWSGLQAAYAELVENVRQQHGVTPERYAAMGVSAMMHGYLAFDAEGELLAPFRTWRNTNTGVAAAELTELLA